MGPADEFLFLKEGQGQHCAVATHCPSNLEGLLSPSPLLDGEAIEEMGGDRRDISPSVDVSIDVIGAVPNDRALRLNVKYVEVGDDRRDIAHTVKGLGVGDESRRGDCGAIAGATVDEPRGAIGEHKEAGRLGDHRANGVELTL